MKILHICICGPFTDGMAYQENELIAQHVKAGHKTTVIAATDAYGPNKQVVHVTPGVSQLACGATLIRLPYLRPLRGWLASKIRAHAELRKNLEQIQPDRILFHGLTAWDLLTVATYVRQNPQVKLFVDCHEDFNNSARSWASRELLHKLFYKKIFQQCVDQIHEVLCITIESLNFAIDFYGSPISKTRMYPLGCTMESTDIVARRRAEFRSRYNLTNSDIVITQTGKIDHTKQLTAALLAFSRNPSPQLRFFIAGQITDDVMAECLPLINNDQRITDLGWQTTEQLRTVLAGADCFLQPFGQTATTQMAMGYGCVILAQDVPSHRWLISDLECLFKDSSELERVFQWVMANQTNLFRKGQVNSQFALNHLDYEQLASQILT